MAGPSSRSLNRKTRQRKQATWFCAHSGFSFDRFLWAPRLPPPPGGSNCMSQWMLQNQDTKLRSPRAHAPSNADPVQWRTPPPHSPRPPAPHPNLPGHPGPGWYRKNGRNPAIHLEAMVAPPRFLLAWCSSTHSVASQVMGSIPGPGAPGPGHPPPPPPQSPRGAPRSPRPKWWPPGCWSGPRPRSGASSWRLALSLFCGGCRVNSLLLFFCAFLFCFVFSFLKGGGEGGGSKGKFRLRVPCFCFFLGFCGWVGGWF